jgi:hypothetical protein
MGGYIPESLELLAPIEQALVNYVLSFQLFDALAKHDPHRFLIFRIKQNVPTYRFKRSSKHDTGGHVCTGLDALVPLR